MTSYHYLLFLSLTFLPPIISDLAADRTALLRLRIAVRGRTLRWNTTAATPCSWRGVTCSTATNRVTRLRLPGSGLRGPLPLNSVGNLTQLQVLSLRGNSLSGELPADLASCKLLEEIHLQGNSFSGQIPASFFTLENLARVNLAGNGFSGNLPPGFNNLTNLWILYLENNNFTGALPDWNSLNQLRNLNVSFNRLTGSVPSNLAFFGEQSFLGTSLCGAPLAGSCSSNSGNRLSGGAIAGIVVGSVIVLLLLLAILFVSWKTYRKLKILPRTERSTMPPSPSVPNQSSLIFNYYSGNERAIKNRGGDGLVFFGEYVEMFSLDELLRSSAEAMEKGKGKGSVGSTYKAYFESGVEVIVKRLKNVCVPEQEFIAKIEEVGSLVHENLEPLRGYFYGRDEKLLLYEPMPRGSLNQLLHLQGNNTTVSWEIRTRISVGTAFAIEYLHTKSSATTHGNIKSSNIFFTDYYNARVTEFGLTHLVSSSSKLSGYRAPEVMDSRRISQKADVYSFGVVLLELVTSKEPDRLLIEEGIELPNWVESVIQEKGMIRVFDPQLVSCETVEEAMMQLVHLALSCTSRTPERRPSMVEVRQRIEEICG
ncbi:hypothetical protein ACS0TY_008516 [Phlomoides rotata]